MDTRLANPETAVNASACASTMRPPGAAWRRQLCARLPLRSPKWEWVEGALGFRIRQGNGAHGFGVSLPDHLLASHFLRAVAHGYFRGRRRLCASIGHRLAHP